MNNLLNPDQSRPQRILRILLPILTVVILLTVLGFIYDLLTHKAYSSRLGFGFSYHKDWVLNTKALDGYSSLAEAQRMNANQFTLSSTNPKCPSTTNPVPKCAMLITGYIVEGDEQSLTNWVKDQTEQSKQAGYEVKKSDQLTIAGHPASRITYSRGKESAVVVYLSVGNKQLALSGYPANSKYRREFNRVAGSFRFN